MKDSPLERARITMAVYLEVAARTHSALLHGSGDVREASAARAPLRAGALRESIEEAAAERLFDPEEHGAMLAQLARAAADEILERRGSALGFPSLDESELVDGVALSLETMLSQLWSQKRWQNLAPLGRSLAKDRGRRREAECEAEELAAPIRKRGPLATDLRELDSKLATRFVDATDDLMLEAISRAAHASGLTPPRRVGPRWSGIETLSALRAEPLDSVLPSRSRASRSAQSLGNELRHALPQRARVTAAHRRFDPRSHIVSIDAPGRIEIIPSALELGVFSELEMHRAYGHALALSLITPALPPALRYPIPGSVARTFGALFTLHYTSAHYERHSDRRTDEALRWTSMANELVRARLLSLQHSAEAGVETLARAFMMEPSIVSPEWISALPASSWEHRADARAALHAPSILLRFRERFDVDWSRNPRLQDPLRAAAGRGGMLAVEDWAAELGIEVDPAVAWLELAQ